MTVEFDWTTFTLEIINFLILVWILKHFLYRPVLDVIARRRADVEKILADARRIELEAGQLKLHNEQQLEQCEKDRETSHARLREELAAERERLMAALEQSIAEERERRQVLDERRQRDFQLAAEERGIAQGAAFSARLLSRAATAELEARLYSLLLEDLRNLPTKERQALGNAAAAPGLQFKVQSAFALDQTRKTELERALCEVTGRVLAVEYCQDQALLAGFQIGIGPWILHANLRDELKFFSGALRHAG